MKKFYKRFLSSPLLDRVIKRMLETFVDVLGKCKHFSFPNNYIYLWKRDMLLEKYESESVFLIRKIIKPGMIVIDIGAHIGYFARLFSKMVGKSGRVYAFEADPEIFHLLKKNTGHLKNIHSKYLAITDCTGMIDFYHSEEKTGCGSILSTVPVEFKKRKVQVPASDLDLFLEQEGVEKADFIKMDIEGGEPAAIRGMRKTLKRNPHIVLITEFAPEWLRAGGIAPLDFLQELRQLGFEIFGILDGKIVPFNPKNEQEMKKIMPIYEGITGFINIYCQRP